jgi:hypothetical protein
MKENEKNRDISDNILTEDSKNVDKIADFKIIVHQNIRISAGAQFFLKEN